MKSRIFLPLLMLAATLFDGLRRPFSTANVESAVGTRKILSRRADGQFAYTHVLVQVGSDAGHGAPCTGANYPIGLTTDSPYQAEDLFNVTPLAMDDSTRKVRVATALGNDIDLYSGAANGFAQALPAVAGTYYKIGRSVGAAVLAATGEYVIEFAPCQPRKAVVIATATGNAATDIAALYAALQGAPDIIKSL